MQAYNQTDQLLHQISQLIAKINKAYLPSKSDDSHTNLYFDELGKRITGRWFSGSEGSYLVVFDLFAWDYQILDETLSVVDRISHIGKKIDQVEVELRDKLKDLGLSVNKLLEPLHFEIPEYPFVDSFLNPPKDRDLEFWSQIRGLANRACFQFLGHIQKKEETRIWPHHFDTGVYVEINKEVGIGFGLAMADTMVPSPYFYLSGYDLKNKSWNWPEVKKLRVGNWIITEHWKGAVLPVQETVLEEEEIFKFTKDSLTWYLVG
jgi:hypothetical protein